MAQSIPLENDALNTSLVSRQGFTITNNHGEKIVSLLHETGSKKLVILCHGFRSSKEDEIIVNLGAAITSKGLSVVSFDFSGNGESEGAFEYGNYWKEVEDLHSIVMHFSKQKYEISAIVGHSKGTYRVTEESLMDRLNIDMRAACLSIENGCRVFTVHGSADETIPVEDAFEIAKLISNHKLHIIEGANHCYTKHQEELANVVVDFLTSNKVEDVTAVVEP